MRELAPAARGSQDAGSRNLVHLSAEYCTMEAQFELFFPATPTGFSRRLRLIATGILTIRLGSLFPLCLFDPSRRDLRTVWVGGWVAIMSDAASRIQPEVQLITAPGKWHPSLTPCYTRHKTRKVRDPHTCIQVFMNEIIAAFH